MGQVLRHQNPFIESEPSGPGFIPLPDVRTCVLAISSHLALLLDESPVYSTRAHGVIIRPSENTPSHPSYLGRFFSSWGQSPLLRLYQVNWAGKLPNLEDKPGCERRYKTGF